MPITGVALKVKIGLKPNGYHDYPQWYTLPLASAGGTQAEKEEIAAAHIRVRWAYDKTSGHEDDTPQSPYGQQWGMLVVSQQFAMEAVAAFPQHVFVMTEAEAQTFWETKTTAHLPGNRFDVDTLVGLKTVRDLLVALGRTNAVTALDIRIARALDPDDPEPGVRRALHPKQWSDAKLRFGFNLAP